MPVINPANGEQLGIVPLSTKLEIEQAVEQAKEAQKAVGARTGSKTCRLFI